MDRYSARAEAERRVWDNACTQDYWEDQADNYREHSGAMALFASLIVAADGDRQREREALAELKGHLHERMEESIIEEEQNVEAERRDAAAEYYAEERRTRWQRQEDWA
jgi:hypothetical protein